MEDSANGAQPPKVLITENLAVTQAQTLETPPSAPNVPVTLQMSGQHFQTILLAAIGHRVRA